MSCFGNMGASPSWTIDSAEVRRLARQMTPDEFERIGAEMKAVEARVRAWTVARMRAAMQPPHSLDEADRP